MHNISDVYKASMAIGNYFSNHYENEEDTSSWSGSEECAVYAEMAYNMEDGNGYERAAEMAYNHILNHGFQKVIDHGWDDFTRGFLAGEMIGAPTPENIARAKIAEAIWNEDDGEEYGYYQEAIEAVLEENY